MKMNHLSDVLPHGVNGEAGSNPLLGGGHLPGADPAVQVPAQIQRHLGTCGHWTLGLINRKFRILNP